MDNMNNDCTLFLYLALCDLIPVNDLHPIVSQSSCNHLTQIVLVSPNSFSCTGKACYSLIIVYNTSLLIFISVTILLAKLICSSCI